VIAGFDCDTLCVMSAKNKQIMQRFVDEVWNKKSQTTVFERLTPEFRHYMPGIPQPVIGPAAYQQLADTFHKAFSRSRMEVDEAFSEGSRVCLLWTFTGTHSGAFNGREASGRKISIPGVGVCRLRGGKIEEVVSLYAAAAFEAMLAGPATRTTRQSRGSAESAPRRKAR